MGAEHVLPVLAVEEAGFGIVDDARPAPAATR